MSKLVQLSNGLRLAAGFVAVWARLVPVVSGASGIFTADCVELSKGAHRLTGTPELAEAAAHIVKRLEGIGVDEIVEQPFPASRTAIKRCELVIDGAEAPLPLLPMRPNAIVPPVSPPEGIRGRLVDAAGGALDVFAERDVKNAIVVLDYNTDREWLRAFRLGARAVIFVRNGNSESWHPHNIRACANLPRFYYDGARGDLATDREAVIHSEVVWEPAGGRNVMALVRGREPVFERETEELVVLGAHLDSFGEVPRLSPGARGAANCAGLLRLAEELVRERPRRNVLLAFFDNQARAHTGVSAFYRALEIDNKIEDHIKLEGRRRSLDAERAFLEAMRQTLKDESPLEAESEVRRQLFNRLKQKGKQHAEAVKGTVFRMLEEAYMLKKESPTPEMSARAAALQDEVAARWQPARNEWNELRRFIGRTTRYGGGVIADNLAEQVREKLDLILRETAADVEIRLAELADEEKVWQADARLNELVAEQWIVLHASLLLGDATPKWGMVIGNTPGLYGKIQSGFLQAYRDLGGAAGGGAHFVVESVDQSLSDPGALWPGQLVHGGEIAEIMGIYNVGFATCQEALPREGTPDDRLDRLDLDTVERQVMEIGALLRKAADSPALSLRRVIVPRKSYVFPEFKDGVPVGPSVMGTLEGSSVPNTPMPGAVVQVRSVALPTLSFERVRPYAYDDFRVYLTDQNGLYGMGPIDQRWSSGVAMTFDERGIVESISDQASFIQVRVRLNTFRCIAGFAALPPQRRTQMPSWARVDILSSRANAVLETKSFSETMDGVICWYTRPNEKGIKIFGLRNVVALNNGPEWPGEEGEVADAQGAGFGVGGTAEMTPLAPRSAGDLWRLNQSRLNVLRAKNIMDSSVAELHGRAEDTLTAGRDETSPVRREALAACSFWASQPVYRKTRDMLDDLVIAVLILLGLCVPFSFAVERVIMGGTTIYRQIGGFAGIFVVTFLTLYVSHPAFAIANTPIIIFLGFAIVVMSAMVIVIIMRKFEAELKAIQGMMTTVHVADVSRLSTFVAAMNMGVSTMRRRPLRTALTAVTIILLTFTILCFASFSTQSGILTLVSAPNPDYSGAFVHDLNWGEISPDVLDVFKGRWGERAAVCPRWWHCPGADPSISDEALITRGDGSSPLQLKGILGMDPREPVYRPDLAAVIGTNLAGTIRVSSAVARALGAETGETVILKGVRLRMGPPLDAVRMAALREMDNSGILPVDFTEPTSQRPADEPEAEDMIAQQRSWTSLPADSVALVSSQAAEEMGLNLRAVLLYTASEHEAVEIVEDLARMLPLPVAGTRPRGVYRHVLGTVLAASGVGDLFFPVLLGGLVIFGTMLGSVTDREREIYTFSALGLSPRHVATLFFAESMVYALIGGMGGYLLAQASMKVLSVLSEYGLVRLPEMNMSSTNTIFTILIVMATVLVSAIYPAIKASRSANPGLLRSWRAPAPRKDVLDLVFPFTVSEYDITGVVSFIKEHFDNYSDTGLGHFMARDAKLVKDENGMLGIDARLALAPFDLGVGQMFSLRTSPSEIGGIDEVRIGIRRTSGQPKDWQRLNKVFLDDLRQQFLIWRSLPHETMELYREKTLVHFG